ncbi:MAG: DUF393 domain-containing protein [Pseudomonadota bacterium]|nr:DUF393 domain-containing protein [Pseudomonadota bacterium]
MQIVYDGDCPFCSRYVAMVRLRDAAGPVELVDARSDHPAARRVKDAGFDLDEGMALIDGDTIHYGDEVVHRLALMSTGSDAFNRLNARIFRSRSAARLLYPVMRFGRNTTLTLMGRRKIGG